MDYKTPEWMNSMIIFSKGREKTRQNILQKILRTTIKMLCIFERTSFTPQLKSNNFAKTSAKFDNPILTPKTYRSIISRFLNKRKISTIPPTAIDDNLISDFKD